MRIDQLPALNELANTDVIPVSRSNALYKATLATLKNVRTYTKTLSNGLTIYAERHYDTVDMRITGTLTEALNTSGAYVTLDTLPAEMRPCISQGSLQEALLNASTLAQVNIPITGAIIVGYTRSAVDGTAKLVASGQYVWYQRTYLAS